MLIELFLLLLLASRYHRLSTAALAPVELRHAACPSAPPFVEVARAMAAPHVADRAVGLQHVASLVISVVISVVIIFIVIII